MVWKNSCKQECGIAAVNKYRVNREDQKIMKTRDIMGIILAGGKGSRMYPFSEHHPKCILPICNRPLMEYQITMMKNLGIEEIVIVIGHYGFDVVRVMGNGEKYGIKLHYVDQGKTLGIAHALGKLESHVDRPFLLFLGDIFFITDSLEPMIEEFERDDTNAVLATKVEQNINAIKRNFSVIEDDNGCVKRVIEKPRHPVNNIKGCGLYLFDLHVFDAVRRTPRTAARDEYEITDSIQILIEDGFKVKSSSVVRDDLNLTFPDDVLMINLEELKRQKKDRLIGRNVHINPAKVHNSVVGDNVVCEQEIVIKNSVVFSNAVIKGSDDIENMIITPFQQIYCHQALSKQADS
jgi:dTDP-glucose pyrophosphorylase